MYSEKLAKTKIEADPKMGAILKSVNTEANLRALVEKYKLHIDKSEEVFSALMLLCYGSITSNECFNAIHEMNVVPDVLFVDFIQDINQKILNPIQDEIKKGVTKDADTIEESYQNSLNNTSVEDDENIEEFFESLGLNPDGSHKETDEEMLARIDREVEEEINKEIEAELAEEERLKNEQSLIKKEIKTFDHDIDLDNIPKSSTPTYNTEHLLPETKFEDEVPKQNKQEPIIKELFDKEDAVLETPQTNSGSIDFIQSRANGTIALKPEPKKNIDQSYIKDPYREQL